MARTLEEVRRDAMALEDADRQLLAEDLIYSRWDPAWLESWGAEIERRRNRLDSGQARELSMDEFFADDAD